MKKNLIRSFVAVVVCALAAVTVFADKVKKVQLTLADDVMVSGTLVKAGTYDFRFSEDTGELAILKNGKVRAKTTARLEQRNDKARDTTVLLRDAGKVSELTGLRFGGSNEEVVVTVAAANR